MKQTPFEKRIFKKTLLEGINTIADNGLELRAYCPTCDCVFTFENAILHLQHKEENRKLLIGSK